MKTLTLTLIALALGVGAYAVSVQQTPSLGGRLPASITATTGTITTATTSVYTSTAGLQKLEITNLGPGVIYCAFGADSVLKNGLAINPLGSSTQVKEVITDPAYLAKPMNCIATANSSTSILKYTVY